MPAELSNKIACDDFSITEKLDYIKKVIEIVSLSFQEVFPDPQYIDDMQKTMLAYVHLYDGKVAQAQNIFQTVSRAYSQSPGNQIYNREIMELGTVI